MSSEKLNPLPPTYFCIANVFSSFLKSNRKAFFLEVSFFQKGIGSFVRLVCPFVLL